MTLPMSKSDGPGRMPGWPDVLALARYAESVGLDSVWICDHLVSEPEAGPPEGVLEAWTILSALAASTRRVTVGTLVTPAALRHPALLAKMAATVDGISGGRLVLGLGAGFPGLEYEWYGFPDDQRLARLEETLEIVGGLLRGPSPYFTMPGRFHRLRDACLLPPPDRPIPLLVAGDGTRLLRLAARHAQAWNTAWYGAPDDRLRARLAAMARALAGEGREAGSLTVTVGVSVTDPDHAMAEEDEFVGSPDDLARVIDEYAELGVDELIVALAPRTERSVDRLVRALTRYRA